MSKPLNFAIGVSDFTKIIQKKCSYIDKTMFIKEIMDDPAEVILITRPRRFGKTLNMSMLEAFFAVQGEDIFTNLNISKETEFCLTHKNKYPVIFISFKDVKASIYDGIFKQIQNVFSRLYERHSYLLDGDTLSSIQKEKFKNVMSENLENPVHLSQALFDLISHIHKYSKVKPIVLIDEYDSPIYSSYSHDFYDQIVEFMRGILAGALKDNPFLEKAVMTGIARVSKESMFSGLNNVQCYTILDQKYAQYFGFTEQEIESLIVEKQTIESIKKWYNGYQIGGYQIYNPWSIVHCLSNNGIMDPYWVNTSDNALVYDLIGKSDDVFKIKIENLIKGIPQELLIYDYLTFNDLDANPNAVWSLLLHAGYLKVASKKTDEYARTTTFVQIPNQEVLWLYADIIEKWFYLNSGDSLYREFITSLNEQDPSKFFKHIQNYIASSMSYFDLSKKTPEQVFHIFMMGILIGFRGRYDVTSNREGGDGRYDVIMTPKDPKNKAVIMEFKVCKDEFKLQETAQTALEQISHKRYTDLFKGDILALGMAFCGKKMMGVHQYIVK